MLGGRSWPWQLPLLLAALSCLPALGSAQLRYSVPEDREPGSPVGDLAKDLGVEVRSLVSRNLRLVSEGGQRHFQVNLAAGVLLLDSRLDREALCGQNPTCSLHLQLVMENPLQLHRVEVDVLDVNDNAPQFPKPEVVLEITEVANPGTRLPLEVAEDPDMGSNSISTYELSPSEHFALSINVRGDGVKMPEIILEKALDREKVAIHHLTLTALDGGNPVKSGTAKVTIHVLDANDNPPVCDPPISKVHLEENVPVGTLVTKLNVTDLDEGPNGDVEYSFKISNNSPGKFTKLFSLDPRTGEIRTKAPLDYEESSAYEIAVRARDKGSPAMEGHCHLRVELIDINDNSPEIVLTSLSSPVQEDATPGTVIALIGVKDSDSGDNGQVRLQIAKELPFKLVSSFKEHFSLVTNGPLDREKASGYNITVRAVDSGSPQRATQKTFYLRIADVNDNAPNFSSPFDTAHIQENALPGTSVFSVSASDPDEGSNAKLSYSILDNGMQDVPISTYFRIDQDNGTIYTVRALDYEQDKVFQVPVEVKDAGSPVLSSTAVVHVFILDENDNAPTIVYPSVPKGSAFHQTIPALAEPGYLVTKIVAVDADSGHNAWLSYQLQETAEALPFQVERRSGEIRVAQALKDSEDPHRLVVEVRDNGTPSLSASVVIVISPEENGVQDFAKSLDLPKSSPKDTNLTLYLIISLVSISLVSCVMFALAAARCLKAGSASWTFTDCCRGTGRKPASHFRGQMKPDGFIKYLDVGGAGLTSQAQNYTSCFSPMSDQSDFLFVKPFSHSSTAETVAAYEQVTSTLASPCDGQAQPNTDWRFSQTQRPGTSGSQNGEEGGAWPNNQFDTEMLQAMILASANEKRGQEGFRQRRHQAVISIRHAVDRDLLKKCHQCVETIVKAKDQQAAEANKNATILLKELDLEKSREESRKQALAAKREKRKEKRKKKKEEQKRKQEEDEENKPKETLELQEDDDEEENDDEVEQEVPIEPPSATTTTTIGISATSTTFTNAFGKKRANVVTTPSTNRKNKKNKTKETPQNMQIILPDQHISLAQQKADKNKINGEPRGGGASGNSDSDNLDSTDCNSESSSGSKSQELNFTMDTNSSERRYASLLIPAQEEKTSASASKTPTRREEVDDSEHFSCQVDGQFDLTLSSQRLDGEGHSNSLSNTYKPVSLPLTSPNVKLNLTSPKRGQKREEGWKEVVRRQVGRVLKDPPPSNNLQPTPIEQFQLQRGGRCCSGAKRSKKLSVPASVVSRIMGRGGCNITAIQDVTGAHIDVDKQKDKNGERMITIRGGTESTRYAVQLINALIQDPAKELEDLIPKTHIRTPASSTKSIHANFSSGVSTATASNKNSFPLGAPPIVTSQSSTLSTFQPANKLNKNVPANVRSSFPVSLPLAYSHPHFALLAAQTMQQIRHPRLPMAQFGGTFSPSPNTWGPFPVRPVNPGSTNSSPKHNSSSRVGSQNGNILPTESPGLATSSCPITVSSVAASTQPLCVTSNRTPSSVRKQLFACVPKTSAAATAISTVTSTCSTLPSTSSAPANSGQVPTAFLPPNAPQTQHSAPKADSFSAVSAPKEKVSTPDQPTANACTPSSVASSCSMSASSNSGVTETRPSSSPAPVNNVQDEILPTSVSEINPSMSMPFSSSSEPASLSLASPRSVVADNQDNSNLPQVAVPAPRVTHRMQSRGSFYSVVPNANLHQDPQSIFVTNQVPLTPSQGPPAAVQLSSAMNVMNSSQMHINPANKSLPPTFGPATLFNHFSTSLFDSNQVPANQGWGDCPLSTRAAADPSFTVQSTFLNNSVLGHVENVHPDNSKAPGFRPPSQRVSTSPVGLPSLDPSNSSTTSSSGPLTGFSANIQGARVYLQGPAPVGTPSFNRQHFSPHPWTSATNSSGESPIPSVSSGSSSPLSAASAPSNLGQPKTGSANQDRKVPPPIGTERLARIRQGGSVTPTPLGTNFTAPVGHSGIWSFGVNSVSEGLSGWSQPVMGNHPMHQQLSDPGTFSQHQPMERDDSGIVAPSNIFHQPMPNSFVDFSKGLPISMYGGTLIPSHPQLADGPGGPLFNGLHTPDPAWNPMIKVVQNSTECTDAQQIWPGTWAPHIGNMHLKYVN